MIQFPLQRKVKYHVVISILFLKLVDFMLDIFLLLLLYFAARNVPIYAKRAKGTIRVILILQIPM